MVRDAQSVDSASCESIFGVACNQAGGTCYLPPLGSGGCPTGAAAIDTEPEDLSCACAAAARQYCCVIPDRDAGKDGGGDGDAGHTDASSQDASDDMSTDAVDAGAEDSPQG